VLRCEEKQRWQDEAADQDQEQLRAILPVKQYEFVRAAKTPISLEFSNEQRVAMIIVLSCCVLGRLVEGRWGFLPMPDDVLDTGLK